MHLPPNLPLTFALIAFGGFGGLIAQFFGLPLPFLLGSLLATAPVAIFASHHLPQAYDFPVAIRVPFVALIGAVIGAQVTLSLVMSLHHMLPSLLAMVVFVLTAQGANYVIFRRLGGYDAPTAFYSGAPGGLIESITFGEASGCDARVLITQQFLRIILVLTLVPLGMSFHLGFPVGSAGGQAFSATPVTASMFPLAAFIVLIGTVAGKALHLPAWQLTGALLVSAGFSLAGIPLSLPNWLIFTAQVVLGASLGMRFAGLNMALLIKGLWLSLLSVGTMLAIAAILAVALVSLTEQPLSVLFITFAPGGVNEMALVALSIGANPAFVTLHHIFRIMITVMLLGYASKRLAATKSGPV
ncbi:AbrB family transcriptional regulator [Lentibacter algarum]|uniref:AbrB family transcriptional regulator n=1 Tax=Lentibacter algarum TaxID=576131 RepID=UPI001C07399E|nr:AbrB family transcriptional regulator [Lentibacter algarum]MBU2982206.1 AbrB family transcriptional regulator [Lentibacter algarum]